MSTKNNQKILTISIAAYNAESSLPRTLASLACDQEIFRKLDILIVDDGSTDNTRRAADAFAAGHPDEVRVISKSNGGYGSTVNEALKEAKGTYFKLLDGDDTFDRAGLEGLVKYLDSFSDSSESAPDLVISPFYYEKEHGDHTETILCDRFKDMQTYPVKIEDARLDDGLMMFELCVRTEVLRTSGVQLTEHCYYTDNEYVMAAELYSSAAVRYSLPVYKYSIGVEGQSMSVKGRRRHHEDKKKAAFGVFDIYGKRCLTSVQPAISGTRKLLTDKLLSTMVREYYMSQMIQEEPALFRNNLVDFDRELSQKWPYIYGISGNSRLVATVRKTGSLIYPLLCRRVLRSELVRMDETVTENEENRTVPALMIAEYAAAACMIIQCRTVYMHIKDYGMHVNRGVWVIMMAALAVCVYCCSYGRNRMLTDKDGSRLKTLIAGSGIFCVAALIYTVVFLAVNPVNYLRVIRCASAVIMMTVLVRSNGGIACGRRILKCFSDLMVLIAAVSVICWVIGTIMNLLPCTGELYIDWSHTGEYVKIPTFLGIYFETQGTDWTIVNARNSGMFVEAPMAGCAYAIALLIDFKNRQFEFKSSRSDMIRAIILIAAIISTLSIICYGFLILLAAAVVCIRSTSGKKMSNTGKILTGAAFIAGIILVVFFTVNKLKSPGNNTRINDFAVGFYAWLEHPFFGGGFESLEYLQRFMPEWRSFDTGFSNSPMEILGQGGVYIAAPYIYAFCISLIRSFRRNDKAFIAATILFAYLFTFIVIPYQYITFFILIMLVRDTGSEAVSDQQIKL